MSKIKKTQGEVFMKKIGTGFREMTLMSLKDFCRLVLNITFLL